RNVTGVQTCALPILGSKSPLDVIIPSTYAAESADVTKKIKIKNIPRILVISVSGNDSNVANKASSTSAVTSSASPPAPNNSTCKAVPPNVTNQRTASTEGTKSTPVINSRIVLPREIRAINNPMKGAHEICHAQKNMVFFPSHSLSEKGFNVKLIGTTFDMYPPSVVTKFSAINNVGPTTKRNNSRSPATPTFMLLNSLIPPSNPLATEIIKQAVTIIIIIICTQALLGIGDK